MISGHEILGRSSAGEGAGKVKVAATAANVLTVRLSSGISANILDFRLPQKHVLGHVIMETGRKTGAGESQAY
jgi:hypothetical protein